MRSKVYFTLIVLVVNILPVNTFGQVYQYGATFQSGTTINTCSGTFYDSGGPTGNYYPGDNYAVTFCPGTPGTSIDLDFTSFSIGVSDHFEIFDGPNTSSPSFGYFTNTINPVDMIIRASAMNTSGCLTIYFQSSSVAPGWAANVNCRTPCQLFLAQIDSLQTLPNPNDTNYIAICPDIPVTFVAFGEYPNNDNTYHQSDDSCLFIWDFGNGEIDTGKVVVHVFDPPSGYDVNLTAIDQNGCNSSNHAVTRVMISQSPFSELPALNSICSADTLIITTGFDPNSTINITPTGHLQETYLELSDTTFLPDGSGASYTTSLTFSVFESSQTLTNPDDLLGICANMEHSYLGDLGIVISCPNGTSITLKEYPGGSSTFLGEPIDNDANLNMGVGYDYCWHSNPTYGTMVSEANLHFYTFTDNAGTTYSNHAYLPPGSYQSYESLSGLVGCPLNGTWTISVTDHLSIDNGYIFNWGIEFSPDLIPGNWSYSVPFESVEWLSPYISTINDTTFQFAADTAGTFDVNVSITDVFGCQYDTVFQISVFNSPASGLQPVIQICDEDTFCVIANYSPENTYIWSNGETSNFFCIMTDSSFTSAMQLTISNIQGCTITQNLIVNHGYTPTIPVIDILTLNDDSILYCSPAITYQWLLNGNLLAGENGQTIIPFAAGDYSVVISDGFGCTATSEPVFMIGIDEQILSESKIIIFPNPSSDFLYISFVGPTPQISSVRIIDIFGRQFDFPKEIFPAGVIKLNVSKLSAGIYEITLFADTETIKKKICIIH